MTPENIILWAITVIMVSLAVMVVALIGTVIVFIVKDSL